MLIDKSGNLVGVVLAAGRSSRMGDFKPLLPIGDEPAIARVVRTLRQAGVETVVVVTGHRRERLLPVLEELSAVEAWNPGFEAGMFSSIRAGFARAAQENPAAVLLMLTDCPLVPASAIQAVIREHTARPDRFIVPCYRGKKGHPLLVPGCFLTEILAHDGTGGLKAVTGRYEDRMIRLETEQEGVVLDMDTPVGYAEVLACAERLRTTAEDAPEKSLPARTGFAGRLLLLRHGETRQHAEKIFLGQTDVPLSGVGKAQAKNAAAALAEMEARLARIHTSDLIRCRETAEMIAAQYVAAGRGPAPEILPHAGLREMHLGDWDGRFIREIRTEDPDAFRRRGEQMLTWKRTNEGENFYDLRYRVVRQLERILRAEANDAAIDVLIVTHAGPIRAILGELLALSAEEAWALKPVRGGLTALNITDGETQVLSDLTGGKGE